MLEYETIKCSLTRDDVYAADKSGTHPLTNAICRAVYGTRSDMARQRFNVNAGLLTQAYLMWGALSKNMIHWWRDWKPHKLTSGDLWIMSQDPIIFPPVFHCYLLTEPQDVYSRDSWNECIRFLNGAVRENAKHLRPAN
jgi:hypothetical protein